ncbi:unnamed protein product [Choristocarpus tenellus]
MGEDFGKNTRELASASSLADFVRLLVNTLPSEMEKVLTTYSKEQPLPDMRGQDCAIIQAIQETKFYQEVAAIYRPGDSGTVCSMTESNGCSCSFSHALSVLSLACLLLIHKKDPPLQPATELCVDPSNGSSGMKWHHDLINGLPHIVANEVRHVARMLEGLVDLEEEEEKRGSRQET